ncbi:MAG TPA: MFS transporter [Hyphomicrobiaceae bacterium]|nr:MFS transporter [Hyphomicrobiaceae bacterium]
MSAQSARPLWLVILSAALVVGVAMGLRNVMGLYQVPLVSEMASKFDPTIGRETFSLAMAIANIVWGIGSPFAGAISDKFGTGRVIVGGALSTMGGLYLMYIATTKLELMLSGFLLGIGVSGTGVTALVGAVGRMAPPEKRMSAMSAVGMGSGLGILIALPYTHFLIENLGWRGSLLVVLFTTAIIIPFAFPLAGKPQQLGGEKPQTLGEALSEAFAHPSFWLLIAGFFVCGFHVTFVGVHLPAFAKDQQLPAWVGSWALMGVGAANVLGTWLAGQSAKIVEKRISLSLIYFARAIIFLGFIYLPMTEVTVIALAAALGLFWLSTIPLTSGLVATFFGPAWMSMLYGIVFLSHQIGSFLGVWLAGYLYDLTKSYTAMWWISVGLGLFAAIVHWPIKERPVERSPVLATAA